MIKNVETAVYKNQTMIFMRPGDDGKIKFDFAIASIQDFQEFNFRKFVYCISGLLYAVGESTPVGLKQEVKLTGEKIKIEIPQKAMLKYAFALDAYQNIN